MANEFFRIINEKIHQNNYLNDFSLIRLCVLRGKGLTCVCKVLIIPGLLVLLSDGVFHTRSCFRKFYPISLGLFFGLCDIVQPCHPLPLLI